MARTRLFSSLEQFLKQRLALTARERELAAQERRVLDQMGRILPGLGYRLVSVNGKGTGSERRQARTHELPKKLKCPRCDRRFSLTMHVARHLNAMHSQRQKARRKARVA